jgi:hypothetical protein
VGKWADRAPAGLVSALRSAPVILTRTAIALTLVDARALCHCKLGTHKVFFSGPGPHAEGFQMTGPRTDKTQVPPRVSRRDLGSRAGRPSIHWLARG